MMHARFPGTKDPLFLFSTDVVERCSDFEPQTQEVGWVILIVTFNGAPRESVISYDELFLVVTANTGI